MFLDVEVLVYAVKGSTNRQVVLQFNHNVLRTKKYKNRDIYYAKYYGKMGQLGEKKLVMKKKKKGKKKEEN